jgi:hypothetical protein
MNEFLDNGYAVIRQAISEETRKTIALQFNMLRNATVYMEGLPQDSLYYNDIQSSLAFGCYCSNITESLLEILRPKIENVTGKNLYPTYSFGRIYYKNSILREHTDRDACEYSATLCLECDETPWEIWMHGLNKEKKSVTLYPGDMCVYLGCDVPHWREKYHGDKHMQVFLHYVDADGKYSNLKYDNRPMLGFS